MIPWTLSIGGDVHNRRGVMARAFSTLIPRCSVKRACSGVKSLSYGKVSKEIQNLLLYSVGGKYWWGWVVGNVSQATQARDLARCPTDARKGQAPRTASVGDQKEGRHGSGRGGEGFTCSRPNQIHARSLFHLERRRECSLAGSLCKPWVLILQCHAWTSRLGRVLDSFQVRLECQLAGRCGAAVSPRASRFIAFVSARRSRPMGASVLTIRAHVRGIPEIWELPLGWRVPGR